MLKVSLDEGFIFDILSIHKIKFDYLSGHKYDLNQKAFDFMSEEIKSQIGLDKYNEIIESVEFDNLIESNKKVFVLIDKAQTSRGFAKTVQNGNGERYSCKVALQKKFFNNEVYEIKTR